MNRGESNPPKSAIWVLRHACPGSHNQALTGDLVEKFRVSWLQVGILVSFEFEEGAQRAVECDYELIASE